MLILDSPFSISGSERPSRNAPLDPCHEFTRSVFTVVWKVLTWQELALFSIVAGTAFHCLFEVSVLEVFTKLWPQC